MGFIKFDAETREFCRKGFRKANIPETSDRILLGVICELGDDIWHGRPYKTKVCQLAKRFNASQTAVKRWLRQLHAAGVLIKERHGPSGLSLRWQRPPPDPRQQASSEPQTRREKAARIRREEAEQAGKIRTKPEIYERAMRNRLEEDEIDRILERDEARRQKASREEARREEMLATARHEQEQLARFRERISKGEQQEIREAALARLPEHVRRAIEKGNSLGPEVLGNMILRIMKERALMSEEAPVAQAPAPRVRKPQPAPNAKTTWPLRSPQKSAPRPEPGPFSGDETLVGFDRSSLSERFKEILKRVEQKLGQPFQKSKPTAPSGVP